MVPVPSNLFLIYYSVFAGPSLPRRKIVVAPSEGDDSESKVPRKRIRMDSREKSAVDEAAETAFVLVQNLTRPFTTTQVKNLHGQRGKERSRRGGGDGLCPRAEPHATLHHHTGESRVEL